MDIVDDGIRELWNPDEDGLNRCREFGKNLQKAYRKVGQGLFVVLLSPFNLLYQIIVMK